MLPFTPVVLQGNGDVEVFEAAFRSLLRHRKVEEVIAIRDQYETKKRLSFAEQLSSMNEIANMSKKGKSLALLAKLKVLPSETNAFIPSSVIPLRDLTWGDDIAFYGANSTLGSMRSFGAKVRDGKGAMRIPKMVAWVKPISYSSTGREAIVQMGFRWSIHFGYSYFLLKQTGVDWKVVDREDEFFC